MTDASPLGRGLGSLIPQKKVTPIPVAPVVTAPVPVVPEPVAPTKIEPPRVVQEEESIGPGQRRILDVPITMIDPNPHQPRHTIGGEPLDDLVSSIRQHGILQPLLMTKRGGRYQIIAGERRFRAAQKLGLSSVPALVREAREIEQLEMAIVENVQRQDLNPVEEAQGYQQLGEEFGLTQEEIARKVGKSRATVANAMRVLTLPSIMLQALRQGTITSSHAKILLSAVTPSEREKLFEQILEQKLPVRAAARLGQQTTVRRYTRRKVDPLVQAKEDELRTHFGTKVSISKREHRGSVAIEFYSEEEFQQLIDRLSTS